MKRLLLVIPLCVFGASLFAGVPDLQDDQHTAMGVRGIALSDSYGSMFANPASLVFNPGSLFVSSWVEDNGYVSEPSSGVLLSFCGRRLGFTVEQTTEFTKRDDDLYNALKYTYLQMDWAMAWNRFSMALSIKAQTAMKRTSVELRSGRELSDLFVQTLLSRYETKPNSTKVSAALGAMLDLDWFKLGVVSDQFAEASNEGNLEFSGKDLYENLCFGLSMASPTFNRESQLNLFKGVFSLELLHPFADSSTLQGGVDVKLQMLPDFQFDVMAGWRQPIDMDDPFALDWKDATQTAGVVLTIQDWQVDGHVEYPAYIYAGDGEPSDVKTTVSVTYSH